MALNENIDYVIAPIVDIGVGNKGMIKGCFIGTQKYLYVIPDEAIALEKNWKEFFSNALSNTQVIETYNFGDKKPREIILEILSEKSTTLQILDNFIEQFKIKWDAVQRIEIEPLDKFKVVSNIFGGSISVRYAGKTLYTPVVIRIPNSHRKIIKAFYLSLIK